MTKRLSDDELEIDKIKHFLMDSYYTPCSSVATVSTLFRKYLHFQKCVIFKISGLFLETKNLDPFFSNG